MKSESADSLVQKKCVPCEGGVPKLDRQQAEQLGTAIPKWELAQNSDAISRKVVCKHFMQAVEMLNQIAEIAEAEQHHPDLHLTGYRKLRIEITTHAIGGLSENDFILAAKIDRILD